jgi:dTMP kinase
MKKGIFITIEGPEGSGKTALIERIKEGSNKFSVFTREPGGVVIAEKIRNIILDNDHTEMDEVTEVLLYAAARRQHLIEKVIPALIEGKSVICDRFIDSSLAYQGHARGAGIDEVLVANQIAVGEFMPDLTLLLDINPAIGLKRIYDDESREYNRLDKENLAFHNKVREGYKILAKKFPERIITIDANRPLDEVYEEAISIICDYITYG